MSVTVPQVYGPDGVLRGVLVYSTTLQRTFFNGVLPDDTIEVQVSINGSGFTSDNSVVEWGDGTWTVPNPYYEPDGLVLLEGSNSVQLRAILPSGSVTPSVEIQATLVSSSGVTAVPPTNISVEQKNESIVISIEKPSVSAGYFRGVNFYASLYEGGGVTGYSMINVNRITDYVTVQESNTFAAQLVDIPVKVDNNGVPVADPLYFRIIGRQEDANEVVLQNDYDESYQVPETARTIQLQTTLSQVRNVVLYQFLHNRSYGPNSVPSTIMNSAFTNTSASQPLYYVATAVYYDPLQNLEYESSFSQEVVGKPATVTTAIGSFPTVNRQDILQEFVKAIFRSNPQIRVEAGSVLRDTVIDPFTSESERLRFLLDFYHRARTPSLLLQIDDPTNSGVSVPVSQSAYKLGLKSALYIDTAADTQALIDSAFDAYSSNLGVTRRSGVSSRGEVTFFTSTRPQSTIVIPLGSQVSGGGVTFSTNRTASIPYDQLASYYDPVSGYYRVNVPVTASITGSKTNVGSGQIKSVVSNINGSIRVTNSAAMVGGRDVESNLDMVVRTQNRLASVDSGTARGYLQTAADVPGVVKANVVSAGDALMQRDLNSSGVHKGGKVEIWVQGENIATVTDTFAFTFVISQDVHFEIVGDPSSLTFRAVDSSLSEIDPIVEMLDNATIGYAFVNASTGDNFDLTNVSILTYNTIQLDTSLVQPSVDLTDVVLGSYRKRLGNEFVLPRQPASSITSVVGTESGTLPVDSYLLVFPDDPLDTGRSALAKDYLRVDGYVDTTTGQTIPSGSTISVVDETHVLIGQYPEYLDNLGASYLTVVVKSSDGLVIYAGPNDPSGVPDYQITVGSQTQALSVTRTNNSTIPNGGSVLISYQHDENFTVTYTTNLIVSLTQESVDANKHATADVIVKEAVPVPVDVECTILLIRGRDPSTVDASLRTNMSNFFSNLRISDPVRQSDIIDVIERTTGVSYVIIPLTKLVRQIGSTVVRESLSTDTAAESSLLVGLTTNSAVVYILNQALSSATVDGGGVEGEFKAVFQDDLATQLLGSGAPINTLGTSSGLSYVIGSDGKSIGGYSDDATLIAAGYTTTSQIKSRRLELTANKVLVSFSPGDNPTAHTYTVTYVVGSDSGAKNIETGAAEYCKVGSLTFTYDEDR
jgi:hypothetical protein